MPLHFDLTRRGVLDDHHAQDVYRFNLARNSALLSGDSAVIRRFYQLGAAATKANDIYQYQELSRSFFYNARPKNAFVYMGLIPWIVESAVRLVTSGGIKINSPLMGEGAFAEARKVDFDAYLKKVAEEYIGLQAKFERGTYLESGLGDFAYRISYDPAVSKMPIVDIIEPQYIEPEYHRGVLKEITLKEATDRIKLGRAYFKQQVIMRERYFKEKTGKVTMEYSFELDGKKITEKGNGELYNAAKAFWGITEMKIKLPFDEFPVVYKKNNKQSELYLQERGVPDIQGLDTIEDALSEDMSNLVDTIRKASPKTFIDEELLPSDIKGKTNEFSDFDHEYLIIKNSPDPTKSLITIQGQIDYQSHIETQKALISHAINKAGYSPTTLGVTGLESINSAAESQDAREKPSMRTREEKHKAWKPTLETLLNRYFQYLAWINKEPIEDYSDMIDISFGEYINPSTESVVDLIGKAIGTQVYSVETGVENRFLHDKQDYTLDDIIAESARIRGITPDAEMALLGLIESPTTEDEQTDETDGDARGADPDEQSNKQPTKALNAEKENNDGK